jgi:hypothetical protein
MSGSWEVSDLLRDVGGGGLSRLSCLQVGFWRCKFSMAQSVFEDIRMSNVWKASFQARASWILSAARSRLRVLVMTEKQN